MVNFMSIESLKPIDYREYFIKKYITEIEDFSDHLVSITFLEKLADGKPVIHHRWLGNHTWTSRSWI